MTRNWRRARAFPQGGNRSYSLLTHSLGRARRRLANDGGFTLVELIIVIIIVPVIVGAIGLGIITVLDQQSSVQNRLKDSSASQLTSALFARDVQSSTMLTLDASAAAPAVCNPGAGAFVLGLQWAQTEVSYWATTSGSNTELTRYVCNGSGTVTNSLGVAAVTSSQAQACVVESGHSGTCQPSGSWTTGWASTAGIPGVSVPVVGSASKYAYTLLAVPRAWTPTSGGTSAGGGNTFIPGVLLLGSGSVFVAGNQANISVNGPIYIAKTASPAITIGNQNSSFTSSTNTLLVYNCAAGGSNCPASEVSSNGGTVTQPVATSTVITDPLSSMPAPTASAAGSCTFSNGGSTETCTPGSYSSAITLGANDATLQLNPGTYVLNGGIQVTGNNDTVTGSGVLLYIGGGAMKFSGNGLTVDLTAPTSGAYATLVVFQSRTDSTALNLTGSGPTAITYGGIVYAPDASVAINADSSNQTASFGPIIAQGITENNNGTVSIG